VPAENEWEALLRVADELSRELGYVEGEDIPGERSPLEAAHGMMGILNPEDELLAAGMRRSLAKVVAALDGDGSAGTAVRAALDAAEMVVRGELLQGNAARLPALLPSVVFLVALPTVGQDRALEISKRCTRLLESGLGK